MLPLKQMLDVNLLLKDMKSYKTANIFGLVAYSERNPFVVKMLQDIVFWHSLNQRAEGWILYAVKPGDKFTGGNLKYIYSSLGVEANELPKLIILSITRDGTIMQRSYSINDENTESAYKSLEKNINTISASVKRILPEYKSYPTVHREVIKALDAKLATEKWKIISASLKEFIYFLLDIR